MEEWVIQVEDEARDMMDGSREMDFLRRRCIYRVPAFIADQNHKAYRPQTVSFGPYHHGEVHLKPMEYHKQRSLHHFLRRTQTPLKIIIDSFAQVEEELKDSYDSLDPKWQSDKEGFLKLMINDGCFMLEIFQANIKTPDDYHSDDPIFSIHGKLNILPFIRQDMLLLENQLPMLVLEMLLKISESFGYARRREQFMNNLILRFCNSEARWQRMEKYLHVLYLYRKSLVFRDDVTHSEVIRRRYHRHSGMSRSAKQLYDAGVIIKRSHPSNQKFSFKGRVLRLPFFIIDEATESTFLNMIAFERCHVGAGSDMTAFVCFMWNLIHSAGDINVLESQGVILTNLGSDQDAANLINTISWGLTVDPSHPLIYILQEVNDYCEMWQNRFQNRCRVAFTNLNENYFSSPWTLISVIAAIVLFGLTITQTVYSALQYYQGSKKP